MSKSYWLKDQKGNFSNAKEDTFDPRKRYVGIRLQQGVPLLDRDWNELEDIRRYEDLMLRRWYLGNGTPDNGFEISQDDSAADDFRIGTGRCMVDGFEAVNEPDKDGYRLYSEQKDLAALTIPPEGDRVGTVYLDAWIEEITGAEDHALKNSNDLNVETCVRHKVEWRVRVAKEGAGYDKDEYHHYYDLAEITWKDGKIIGVEDLRITNLTLASVSSVRDELEYARKGTVNRWIKGGEVECERSGDGYGFIIGEMRCIMGGRVIKFVRAEKSEEIKEGENCVILARTSGADIRPEIEFIVTRSNLLEWLNDWTSEKWMPAGYTEPVLKSAFTLPLYFFERPSKDENLKKGFGGTFSYFELGKAIELESILSGDRLPTYKELARYVFYTATGEEFKSKAMNEKKNLVGESSNYKVYLFYEPDIEKLKNIALTLERAKSIGKPGNKRRLVFAPTKYLDQAHLDELRIDFAQLPFEIYELAR